MSIMICLTNPLMIGILFFPLGNYNHAVISTLPQITGIVYPCGNSLGISLKMIYILIFDTIATLPSEIQHCTVAIYTPIKSI